MSEQRQQVSLRLYENIRFLFDLIWKRKIEDKIFFGGLLTYFVTWKINIFGTDQNDQITAYLFSILSAPNYVYKFNYINWAPKSKSEKKKLKWQFWAVRNILTAPKEKYGMDKNNKIKNISHSLWVISSYLDEIAFIKNYNRCDWLSIRWGECKIWKNGGEMKS